MKLKIIILICALLLNINISLCEDVTIYDTFDFSGSSISEIDYIKVHNFNTPKYISSILINDIVEFQGFNYMVVEMPTIATRNTPLNSNFDTSVTFKIDGDIVGTGIFGYSKSADESTTFLQLHCWEGELNIGTKTGSKVMEFTNNSITNIYLYSNSPSYPYGVRYTVPTSNNKYAFFNSASGNLPAGYLTQSLSISSDYTHSYPFSYTATDNLNLIYMDRDTTNTTKALINIGGVEEYNETSLKTTDLNYISYDKSNTSWDIVMENIYGDINEKTLYFIANGVSPLLFTDKTLYNSSEIIAVTWQNIDYFYDEQIKWGTSKPYEMHIVYYDYDSQRYEAKYQEWLTHNLEDETLYLDSSLFTPQQNYKVIITSNDGDFHKENTWLISYDFDVIPDDEYLSLSCNAPNCYTYTNGEIDIYYKINNNSVIKVYDNDNNLVHAWYNIIGSGYKTYTIPSDINQLNTYPNWKVYLNNTGYSTSYDAELLVYYSTMVTPTPTPTPIIDEPINESVEDMITELKDESKPIFDLIYGLSTIIVDNPDYDDSGIIDEYEINNWINNLVPLLIVFFLFVMYLGLKKENRGDKP